MLLTFHTDAAEAQYVMVREYICWAANILDNSIGQRLLKVVAAISS